MAARQTEQRSQDERSPKSGLPESSTAGSADPVNIHVGRRIRARREELKLKQNHLAKALGITFQQVQKYEAGLNRIPAERLFDLMRILEVDANYFFKDMPQDILSGRPSVDEIISRGMVKQIEGQLTDPIAPEPVYEDDAIAHDETLALVRDYWRLPSGARAAIRATMIYMQKKDG